METDNCEKYIAIEIDQLENAKSDETSIIMIHDLIQNIYTDVTSAMIAEGYAYLKKSLINKYPVEYMSENYNDLVSAAMSDNREYRQAYYGGLYGFPSMSQKLCNEIDTFIVDKKMDYIFSLMIDVLIFEKGVEEESNKVSEDDYDLMIARFRRRTQLHKCCNESDSTCNSIKLQKTDLCPLCHVLYTRLDSEFYRRSVSKLMKNGSNKMIDFNTGAYEFMDIEHLPFELVLFLCGDKIIPETTNHSNAPMSNDVATYNGVSQWVRVPIWFVALSGGDDD